MKHFLGNGKMQTKTEIRESGVTVGDIQVVEPKPEKTAVIVRKVSSETAALEMASRLTGKLIGFDDLFDAKTGKFLTDAELQKSGAAFVTVYMDKVMGKSDVLAKSRFDKSPTPYIRKTSAYQIIININWESYIAKRGTATFIPADSRANGVENIVPECKGIGKTQKGNCTINGVILRTIEKTRYFDENGVEYTDIKGENGLQNEFFKKTVAAEQKGRAVEAEKHGIEERFDPQYRTTRIDSCRSVRAWGMDYQPTDNNQNG